MNAIYPIIEYEAIIEPSPVIQQWRKSAGRAMSMDETITLALESTHD